MNYSSRFRTDRFHVGDHPARKRQARWNLAKAILLTGLAVLALSLTGCVNPETRLGAFGGIAVQGEGFESAQYGGSIEVSGDHWHEETQGWGRHGLRLDYRRTGDVSPAKISSDALDLSYLARLYLTGDEESTFRPYFSIRLGGGTEWVQTADKRIEAHSGLAGAGLGLDMGPLFIELGATHRIVMDENELQDWESDSFGVLIGGRIKW